MDKSVCSGETKTGRRGRSFRGERRRKEPNCVYPEEDFIRIRRCWKPTDVAKFESDRCSLSPDAHGPTGWTWSTLSGLCSRGAAAAFRPTTTAPFLSPVCRKNTLLDTHKPSIASPDPDQMHIFLSKACFSAANSLERIAVFCPFRIFHSWGGEDERWCKHR